MTDLLRAGLPTNTDAERFVLGSVLLDEATLHSVRAILTGDDFALEKHRRIWRRVCELYDQGGHVDRVTVANILMQYGELESCDGLSYLVSLDDGLPQIPNLESYVQILRDDATRRRIIGVGQSLITRACNRDAPQEILDSVGQAVLDMAPQETGRGLQSAKDLVDEVGISKLLAPRRDRGLMFPWGWMNEATCGLLAGELWVLAGHTSTGKTSAALQFGVGVARKGTGVAIFSLEVGKESLFLKAVYQLSRVDSERAKRGDCTPEEKKAVNLAANEIYGLPIYFDTASTTTMAIHAAVRRQKLKGPVGLVIVDYLQLLGNTGRYDNRSQAVGANAWALKLMANEFKCPVLLLSQFSRESDKPGKRRKPELSDLKESGDIENHANGVWFIHRESMEDAEQIPVEFILPKQRDGRRNIWQQFYFFPRYQRFDGADGTPQ
jgi:replicative DNA helicase